MKELSLQEMQEVNGGGVMTVIIYCILGVGAYKIIKSKRGRISIPRLIQLEWKQE